MWFNGHTPINVAIKTVKNSTEQERVKLLQEAAIMGQFAHKYVVRLMGVVTVGEPVSSVGIHAWVDRCTGNKLVCKGIMGPHDRRRGGGIPPHTHTYSSCVRGVPFSGVSTAL